MTKIVKAFSVLVLALTFPNPTLVRLLSVKYNAVRYVHRVSGPDPSTLLLYGTLTSFASLSNQPSLLFLWSSRPIAYQPQANQWAARAKPTLRSTRRAVPYSEYRSSFRATRTRRRRRAVFRRPIRVVVYERGVKIVLKFKKRYNLF